MQNHGKCIICLSLSLSLSRLDEKVKPFSIRTEMVSDLCIELGLGPLRRTHCLQMANTLSHKWHLPSTMKQLPVPCVLNLTWKTFLFLVDLLPSPSLQRNQNFEKPRPHPSIVNWNLNCQILMKIPSMFHFSFLDCSL